MSNPSTGNHKAFLRIKRLLKTNPNISEESVIRQCNDGHGYKWLHAVVSRARRELKEEKAFLSERTGV